MAAAMGQQQGNRAGQALPLLVLAADEVLRYYARQWERTKWNPDSLYGELFKAVLTVVERVEKENTWREWQEKAGQALRVLANKGVVA